MNRNARAFRATALFTGFGYAAQALSLVAIPLYLRTIGADGYGLMVLTLTFMGYLNFADAGLSWGSMILVGQAHGRQDRPLIGKIVRNSVVLAVASGAVIGLTLAFMLGAASQGYRLPMFARHPEADALVALAGVQLMISLLAGVFFNLFQGLQEAYWTAFYQGLGRLVAMVAMMVVAWVQHSVWSVMLAQLVVTALFGAACALHACLRHRWVLAGGTWIDAAQMNFQIRTGLKVFLLQVGRTITASAPVMALSSAIGPAAVPLYTVPTTLLQLAFMPLNAWSTSLHSAYGEAYESGNRRWVVETFRRTMERGFFWGACGAALFLPLAIPFVSLWTGGRLTPPAFMPLAVVAIAFLSWFELTGQYLLSGLNRQRKVAVAEILCGLVAIGSCALAARWLGPAGVGLGLLVPALLISVRVTVSEIRCHLGRDAFPVPRFSLQVAAVLAVAWGAGCLLITGFDGGNVTQRLVTIAAGAGITLVVYCACSVLLRLDFVAELGRQLTLVVKGGEPGTVES